MNANAPKATRRTVLMGALAIACLAPVAKAQKGNAPASEEPTTMKVRMTFNGQTMVATLSDNPSARDFASMLPLELTIEDYGRNEKIVHLPRKLTEESAGPFDNERPGDLCYFVPWGNLALFYAGYRWSNGLIRLGRMDNWREALGNRGSFPVRLTLSAS